jgi:hypothetical protein
MFASGVETDFACPALADLNIMVCYTRLASVRGAGFMAATTNVRVLNTPAWLINAGCLAGNSLFLSRQRARKAKPRNLEAADFRF